MIPPAVFCDFDGTVCLPDSTEYLLERFASPVWRELDKAVQGGKLTEREAMARQVDLLRVEWPEARASLLSGVRLREGFPQFVEWCRARDLRPVILSSGLAVLIKELLEYAGIRGLEIHASDAKIVGNRWRFVPYPGARFEEHCSHCKCVHVQTARDQGKTVIYIGDGYTDRCPVRRANVIFATNALAEWLAREGMPYTFYRTFHDIISSLELSLQHYPTSDHAAC